jgi:hypothetical protein
MIRSSSEEFRTEEPCGLDRNMSGRNVSVSCLPASNEDDSVHESNKSCLSAAGRATLRSISEDPVEATCSLESRHCTPDIVARDLADELDEHDMVGIHVVGDNMRGRLAEKHRMLELALSRSSFRYALAPLPCTDLKHVITLANPPVSWIRSEVSGMPSLPCLLLN